jgi:hypothetical protein
VVNHINVPPNRIDESAASDDVFLAEDESRISNEATSWLFRSLKNSFFDAIDLIQSRMYVDDHPLRLKFRLNGSRWALFFTRNHCYLIFRSS